MNQKKEFTMNYGGKEVIVETGRIAKQADGAVLVTCDDTQVLVTACSARTVKDGQDFFPLLVEYQEKFYSAGKFLGGFIKREARPSTQETLTARLIDRPLRPLFPEGYMFDTVITATVLSYGEKGDPEVLAGLGASAALSISDIPFLKPTGSCKVGRINGQFVLNPDHTQWAESDMEIAVAGSDDAILMVEGEAKEIPEAEVLAAIKFGHEHIKQYCAMVDKMQKEVGRPKRKFESVAPKTGLMNAVYAEFEGVARKALEINPKLERQNAVWELETAVAAALKANPAKFSVDESCEFKKEAKKVVDELLYKMMRADILEKDKRIGGRKLTQVRPIETEVSVLRRPHGSALFTRGETQVLSTVTLGGSVGEQMADRIVGIMYDKFYLHYNFPGYSVAEAQGKRGTGRRELGHGNLAERALKAVMPKTGFDYTTRVVCEVTESNGSSSMGSVCSGCLALMDAGVPITSPVAGVAMGLITDGSKFKILTDILGDEDHLGDMDFKVAGTSKGITAVQMDIKISGLTFEIMEKAFAQAHEGRAHILNEMLKSLSKPREEYKSGVPLIASIKIPQDSIGALIGPGGKNIKKLQETFKVTVEVTEDGTVKVITDNKEMQEKAINTIDLQINGPQVGTEYLADVVTIKEYGAFVDIAPGISGLVHVSEIANDKVQDVNDYLTVGEKIQIKVLEVDKMGRLKLSAKAVKPIEKKK